MFKRLAICGIVLALGTTLNAAAVSTTLTINGTGSLSGGTNITASGTVTMTNIGSGTMSSSFSLLSAAQSGSAPFTITITSGSPTGTLTCTLKGDISLLAQVFAGSPSASGPATVTVTAGTGGLAGTTGTIQVTASGTGTGSGGAGSGSFKITGSGTLTIPGGGGGGGGGGSNPPTVSAVQNNYGQIPQGLPNYGIAPGTIFFIKGDALANTTTSLLSSASPGLQTNVSGVTVSATVGSTTMLCPIYYLSPTQIDAVLPGNMPTGTGTVTVTNNGQTSAAAQITVVQSAFGILSYNGSLGAAYDASNNLITSSNAANFNQTIVLWGSGVGGDPGNDDKLFPQKQNNLTSIPMQAYVGGVQATIAYRGRSQFPGLDQVVITLPGSVPTGCYVSVVIVSNNIVSNFVTIPVAASGSTCSDTTTIPPDVISKLAGKTSVNEGVLSITHETSISQVGTQTFDGVGGFFQAITGFGSGSTSQTSIGSCIVYNALGGSATGSSTGLDAGASISVNGPAGAVSLSPIALLGAGFYAPPNGQAPAGFVPSGGGAFTFDNASGGKDVGHFNVVLNAPPILNWQNASQVASVTRSQGVTVTWSGGAPGSYVQISGSSSTTVNGKTYAVSFVCQANQSAGQFTVPVPVLLALPASANGTLSVTDYATFQTFTASGLDLGIALAGSGTSKSLAYN